MQLFQLLRSTSRNIFTWELHFNCNRNDGYDAESFKYYQMPSNAKFNVYEIFFEI